MNPRLLLYVLLLTLALYPGKEIFASDDEQTAILLGDTIIPTASFARHVRPLNQVAENVTIISREDIDRLQAHSLGDVLQFYPGVLAYPMRMSFDLSVPMVQGLPSRHTLVTLDGLPLNNGSDGAIDIGIIPTGFLDHIEIVKGPASSVWGRSVGAVINLVTKEPSRDRLLTGQASGTWGSKNSKYSDININGYSLATGTGYVLAGTANGTDGFQKGIDGDGRSVYAKLTQDIGPNTDVSVLFARSAANRNMLYIPQQNIRGEYDGASYFSIGKLHHKFASGSDFDAQIYAYNLAVDTRIYNLKPIPPFIPVPGIKLQTAGIREENEGIQLSYKKSASHYWYTLGIDASIGSLRNSDMSLAPPPHNIRTKSDPTNAAWYISGGYNFTEKLTLTGSYRYDWYSEFDTTHSPNVGVIYQLTDKTLLRATYGYGYNLPTAASKTKEFETMWRAQFGVETNDIPYMWFKINGFYDRTQNMNLAVKFFDQGPVTTKELTREGFEVEAKTIAFLNTSFGLGYTYANIYDTNNGEVVKDLPRHQLLVSANYRAHGTDAALYGRYINWNGTTSNDQMVWDFLLTQKVYSWETGNANLTFSARNLFGGNQQSSETFPNPPFRLDGGFVVNF